MVTTFFTLNKNVVCVIQTDDRVNISIKDGSL